MKTPFTPSAEGPCAVLGVDAQADPQALRAAYLEKVKQFPPDRFPEEFERIRDAYDYLKNPRHRAIAFLHGGEGKFAELLAGEKPERCYVGQRPWMAAMREREKGPQP